MNTYELSEIIKRIVDGYEYSELDDAQDLLDDALGIFEIIKITWEREQEMLH